MPARFTKIVTRRREPGEFPTARVAIRNHCLECVGYRHSEVAGCSGPKCWLFPWRFGMTPERARKEGRQID